MGSILGSFLAGVGIVFAASAVVLLLRASGLVGGVPRPEFLMGGVVVFLVGLFAFGYGVGRRVAH